MPFSEQALAVSSMCVESSECTKLGGKAERCFWTLTLVLGAQSSCTTRACRLVRMLRPMFVLYTAKWFSVTSIEMWDEAVNML